MMFYIEKRVETQNIMITLYGITNCDTVRKARKWLDEHHTEYQFADLKKVDLPDTLLSAWLAQVGEDTLINKRGRTWQQLPPEAKEKAAAHSADLIALCQDKPTLLKRPIIVQNDQIVIVGFNVERYTQHFA